MNCSIPDTTIGSASPPRALLYGITALLLLALTAGPSAAETPVYQAEPSGEFLKTWLLCGPFPVVEISDYESDLVHLPGFETDFLADHGGEASPRIEEGQRETFEGGSATWFRYTSEADVLSLDEAVTQEPYVAAYAYCEIESPRDQICVLGLGTNDGGRLWLNGETIWERTEGRGHVVDDDLIAVRLVEGRNTLLAKIEERGGSWALSVRLVPFDGALLVERGPLFGFDHRDDGTAALRLLHPASVADGICRPEARLEILSAGEPEEVAWRGHWNNEPSMPLPVGHNGYGEYVLRLKATLEDGFEWGAELPFDAGERLEHVLFDGGRTDYVIVVGEDASESERWAAEDLQGWLREIGGAEFPIRSDLEEAPKHQIVVGFNRRAKALLGDGVDPPDTLDQSFTYRNVGPAIVIWGGKQAGTMYGVSTFLERELGCRWYSPSASVAPKRSRYAFRYLRHGESPDIRVRNVYYFEAFDPVWAARQKINGAMAKRQQPGGVELYWGVHTFFGFIPPSEFFADHPEYFSLIDGKRTYVEAQLCLSNPDVLAITTERLRRVMRENPDYLIYSVSHMDWKGHCQCDKCQDIAQREESQAGPLIWFVNQVAEQVEAEFPDKFVGTLAYIDTQKPCKTLRPRHNVVIRLCTSGCRCHHFYECPENAEFLECLETWASIAPHLYIWDYIVNFANYMTPYPNLRVLQPNIQAFRDNHAIGVMEQAASQGRGTEFAELRAYTLAKLLWNPDCDADEVMDDFVRGYYGRAGQYIQEYLDFLHSRITPEAHMRVDIKPSDAMFGDGFVRKAEAIFDQAERVADDEEILHRVETARLTIMNLKCLRQPYEARRDGTLARYRAIAERERVTHYAEYGRYVSSGFDKQMATTE